MRLPTDKQRSALPDGVPQSEPHQSAMPAPEVERDAKEVLELLELELTGLIRQLERAANSVSEGVEATATALMAIRQRSDTLTDHAAAAQETATAYSEATERVTCSAQGIGSQVLDATRLADQVSAAAREASLNVDRLRESSAAIGNVVNLIAQIAKQTTLLALNSTIEAARAGPAGRGFAVVATEVKALAAETRSATEEVKKRIEVLQRDAAGSAEAVYRISQAIEAIRPVFDSMNGAVVEQHKITNEMSETGATASRFIASVGGRTNEIDSATKDAQSHGENVANAGRSVTAFAQKLRSRCAVLLRQPERELERKKERLPCNLKLQIKTAHDVLPVPIYQISTEGILVGGQEIRRFSQNEILDAHVEDIGNCRVWVSEHSPGGTWARFESAEGDLSRAVDDKLWSIRDENVELVTRAMEAGVTLTQIFEAALATGEISIEDMFDSNYVEIPSTNPAQYRTRILDWADRALPTFLESFLTRDTRMVTCAAIDRNGYMPVNNLKFSKPQRPGDVAWNTANSRNRRIFKDSAGLAAAGNERSYLIQSYARDMGNGNTIMMREIDVPIRVTGRHWGGFRTVYTL